MYEANKSKLIEFLKSEERSQSHLAIITRMNSYTLRSIINGSREMSDKMFFKISTWLLDYYEDKYNELTLLLKREG